MSNKIYPQAANLREYNHVTKPANDKQYNFKCKPAYHKDLLNYSKNNPVLVATDWKIVNFIHRLHGICLFCDFERNYDFTCFVNREVWIVYTSREYIDFVFQIGRKLQLAGVSKVLLLLMNPIMLEESND